MIKSLIFISITMVSSTALSNEHRIVFESVAQVTRSHEHIRIFQNNINQRADGQQLTIDNVRYAEPVSNSCEHYAMLAMQASDQYIFFATYTDKIIYDKKVEGLEVKASSITCGVFRK